MKAGYSAEVGAAVGLIAATPKTVLTVIAPASFGVDLRQIRVAFDGITANAVPVLVEVVTYTADGTGTAGTVNQAYGRIITPGFTTKYNYSAEPTGPTSIDRYTLTPNGGTLVYDYPSDRTPDTNVSALIGIRCTAPAGVNVNATMVFERC